MSFGFFIVGSVIFTVYITALLWIMNDQNKKQRKEGNGTKLPKTEEEDYVDI